MTIRVVCGEDSYIAREGILRALEDEEDIEVVATCGDFDSLRALVDDLVPDVVLTDISMPPTNTDEGIRLAEELRGTHPGMGLVILSQYAEPVYATQLLEEGSDRRAYLLKDRVARLADFLEAVDRVGNGGFVVDPEVVATLFGRRRAPGPLDDLASVRAGATVTIDPRSNDRDPAGASLAVPTIITTPSVGSFSFLAWPSVAKTNPKPAHARERPSRSSSTTDLTRSTPIA